MSRSGGRRRPFNSWALAAFVLMAMRGPAMALTQAEQQELARRQVEGPGPQLLRLNDVAIDQYRRPPGGDWQHEFLVLHRGTAPPIELAAASFTMRNLQVGGQGPNAIYIGSSGGAHCCFTAHLIWIEGSIRHQAIELGSSDLEIQSTGGVPRLRFHDFAFADWHASLAESPAPLVVLSYDSGAEEYIADRLAMRQPPPDEAALAEQAQAIRKVYEDLPADRLDPGLWSAMLDLIYSGNAAVARHLLDQAWPPGRAGKDVFLGDFTRQLWGGTTWRRFDLGQVLRAAGAFPPPAP
jgi:hypothetical protein